MCSANIIDKILFLSISLIKSRVHVSKVSTMFWFIELENEKPNQLCINL